MAAKYRRSQELLQVHYKPLSMENSLQWPESVTNKELWRQCKQNPIAKDCQKEKVWLDLSHL